MKMASKITKSETQNDLDVKKRLHNDLHEFLVCQKCKEVPKYGPIYSCDSGDHATCQYCFKTSKVCKCKANIKVRNKGLEKVRTTLPMSCKFRKNGCNAVLTLESLLYHERDCQFRVIFCIFLDCFCNSQKIPKIIFKNLEDHLTEKHTQIDNANTSYIEFQCPFFHKDTPGPTKLVLNNSQFFYVMAMKNDRYYFWAYYYGSSEEAKNYNCTIKLFGGDEEYSYNGPPRSLDESRDEIIWKEYALCLGFEQFVRLIQKDRQYDFDYSVKISCPKDEARDEDVESGISDNENTTSNHST
jgi:hypothetical protein